MKYGFKEIINPFILLLCPMRKKMEICVWRGRGETLYSMEKRSEYQMRMQICDTPLVHKGTRQYELLLALPIGKVIHSF